MVRVSLNTPLGDQHRGHFRSTVKQKGRAEGGGGGGANNPELKIRGESDIVGVSMYQTLRLSVGQ